MAKRRCKGAFVRIEFPDKRDTLPPDTRALLKEAAEFGVLRAHSIWKMSKRDATGHITYIEINDETFREDRERFQEIAADNTGLFHLLLSVFFTKIHQEIEPRASAHKTRSRNEYLVAGMAQREFSQVCLTLTEKDAAMIPVVDSAQFGVSPHIWRIAFAGGRSVARIISAFRNRGAEIFFPIAYIDIQGRIDLLVQFPSNGLGLCIQVKTMHQLSRIRYRLIPEVSFHRRDELTKSDQHFLNGITEFRNQNNGIWLPLEIEIGNAAYTQTYIDPPTSIMHWFDCMIQDLNAWAINPPTP